MSRGRRQDGSSGASVGSLHPQWGPARETQPFPPLMERNENTGTPVLTAALFAAVKTWKHPEHPAEE